MRNFPKFLDFDSTSLKFLSPKLSQILDRRFDFTSLFRNKPAKPLSCLTLLNPDLPSGVLPKTMLLQVINVV